MFVGVAHVPVDGDVLFWWWYWQLCERLVALARVAVDAVNFRFLLATLEPIVTLRSSDNHFDITGYCSSYLLRMSQN